MSLIQSHSSNYGTVTFLVLQLRHLVGCIRLPSQLCKRKTNSINMIIVQRSISKFSKFLTFSYNNITTTGWWHFQGFCKIIIVLAQIVWSLLLSYFSLPLWELNTNLGWTYNYSSEKLLWFTLEGITTTTNSLRKYSCTPIQNNANMIKYMYVWRSTSFFRN